MPLSSIKAASDCSYVVGVALVEDEDVAEEEADVPRAVRVGGEGGRRPVDRRRGETVNPVIKDLIDAWAHGTRERLQ